MSNYYYFGIIILVVQKCKNGLVYNIILYFYGLILFFNSLLVCNLFMSNDVITNKREIAFIIHQTIGADSHLSTKSKRNGRRTYFDESVISFYKYFTCSHSFQFLVI